MQAEGLAQPHTLGRMFKHIVSGQFGRVGVLFLLLSLSLQKQRLEPADGTLRYCRAYLTPGKSGIISPCSCFPEA